MENDLYKISSKRNEKWFTWGNVKKREKGYSGGIKKTPEFVKWVEETPDGAFLNFLLFTDKAKPDYKPAMTQSGRVVDEDQDQIIPF